MAMDITALRLMELKDIKVSRMISDSVDAEPVYDNPVDLAGALSFQVSPELENKTLYGDSTIMDSYSRTTSINFTVTNSVVSLAGLEVIMGGQILTTGAAAAETVTYELTAKNATPPYFKIEGKWDYVGENIGDAHIVLHKCRLSEPPDFTVNDSSGDFGDCSFTGTAMPTRKSGHWWQLILNKEEKDIETYDNLVSIAITTAPTKSSYAIGEALDLTGLVVEGTYEDTTKKNLTITMANISGFDSSSAAANQTVIVTVGTLTTTFKVTIRS